MRGLGTPNDPYSSGSPLTLGTNNQINVWPISYREVKNRDGETLQETATANDLAGTRTFLVDWADRQQALYQILGFSWLDFDAGSYGIIRRYLPEYNPDYIISAFGAPTNQTAFVTATRARCQGLKPTGYRNVDVQHIPGEIALSTKDVGTYKKARIVVDYDFLPYDIYPDSSISLVTFADATNSWGGTDKGYSEFFSGSKMGRWISFERHPAAEYLSIPVNLTSKESNSGFLKWSDNKINSRIGTSFPGNVGFIIGHIDFKFTWHQVPYEALPNKTIANLLGRVNLRPVGLPGGPTTVADPGKLLLLQADSQIANTPYGNRLWNVQYTIRYNPRGHNNFYDFIAGDWYQASKDGKYYAYDNGGADYFPPTGTVNRGATRDPPDGVLLYDSRDFTRLFCPEYSTSTLRT